MKKVILVSVVLIAIIFLSGCIQEKPEKEGEYVFIDQHIHTYGELIEGDHLPSNIDFPTYSFDNETGILEEWSETSLEINESLKAIYGHGQSLSGVAGSGKATGLSGVYELPYKEDKFRILKIDSNGTAYLEYKKVSIILRSGEEWTNITSKISISDYKGQTSKANLTITNKIINYGILNKSKIEQQ